MNDRQGPLFCCYNYYYCMNKLGGWMMEESLSFAYLFEFPERVEGTFTGGGGWYGGRLASLFCGANNIISCR